MNIKLAILPVLALSLASCATPPKKIGAQYVSPQQYRSYDCDQIVEEQARIERRTNVLYHSLKKDSDADKWQMGVGLILFWPVLFALEGGDGPEASEYARLQGEYESLRTNSVERKCNAQFKADLKDTIKKEEKSAK